MVAHICNPRTLKVEAGGSKAGLHSKTLSHKKKKKKGRGQKHIKLSLKDVIIKPRL
jgi:hypothetical protein